MAKAVSQRTCIGCRTKKLKDKLVRIVINKKGNIVVDSKGGISGRGAYLCRTNAKDKVNKKCLAQAIKKNAFNYAFKKKISSIKITSSANGGCSGSC